MNLRSLVPGSFPERQGSGAASAARIAVREFVPVVLVLVAHVLRARQAEDVVGALVRPTLLVPGALLGAVAIAAGFPTLLAGRVDLVAYRLLGNPAARAAQATGPDGPVWWWFLRGYASGFGWPLFVGVAAGTAIALWTLDREDDATALVAGCLGMFVILFAPWHDFRPHHLVPTMALLVLLGALGLVRLRRRHPTAGGLAVAALVVTAGLYAGVGAMQYADTPRQDARAWVEDHVPREATMESYQHGFEHAVAPTWPRMSYPNGGDPTGGKTVACPDYIQLVSEDLYYLRDAPPDERVRYTRTDTAARAGYVRGLLNGSRNYEVVATFGNPPDDYVVDRTEPGSLTDLLPLGVVPHSGRYGDEQELAGRQYVVILERTGPCEGGRSLPW